MNDLFFQTSFGAGGFVFGDIKTVDDGLPDKYRDEFKNKFNMFVFGHPIVPSEARSPLFRNRNMIAQFDCVYQGTKRGIVCTDFSETAEAFTDAIFNNDDLKEVVVVNNFSLDIDSSNEGDLQYLLKNFYNMIKFDVTRHYNANGDDLVICWFLSDEELEYMRNYMNSDVFSKNSFKFIEENNLLMLH